MKISQVLLRWHKSFNINYNGYDNVFDTDAERPWNALNLPKGHKPNDYGYIEIPLESDVTTIVGANESGKSHLLDAICKVILGTGDDDRPASDDDKAFSATDLCHFSAMRSKDTNVWPNIGLRFSGVSDEEIKKILLIVNTEEGNSAGGEPSSFKSIEAREFVLILAPTSEDEDTTQAYLYSGQQHVGLNAQKLHALREHLPQVKFLRSTLPLANEIALPTLIAAYPNSATQEPVVTYEINSTYSILSDLRAMTLPAANDTAAFSNFSNEFTTLKINAKDAELKGDQAGRLEAILFHDVLGIELSTLKKIASYKTKKRSYVENIIGQWNQLLSERLNLERYWQQDPSFNLQIDYKGGILYFEITDKTGSKYTFGERSSGLRYFLSYYIQAKALEQATKGRQSIILMDEPDSFLSTQGQRNLLMVFESLVGADTSRGNTQLVYTTHSSWLINRNFPGRIRLVRKGDAEEGTQYIHSSVLRRYEPVRSALGVDYAQTLFMGATNLVLESPTDQYLLTELIRCFANPMNLLHYLDLNSLVTLSTDRIERIEQVLVASRWADEIQPATVVVINQNDQGDQIRSRLTQRYQEWDAEKSVWSGRTGNPLINERFVVSMPQLLGHGFNELNGGRAQQVATMEDLFPSALYAHAVWLYCQRWQPDLFEAKKREIEALIDAIEFGNEGVVKSTGDLFKSLELSENYDRFGVAQEAILLVQKRPDKYLETIDELNRRLRELCRSLYIKIEDSEQTQKTTTGQSNIRRKLKDFQKGKQRASIRQLTVCFDQIKRELDYLGADGDALRTYVSQCQHELNELVTVDIEVLDGQAWDLWKDYLEHLYRHALKPLKSPPTRTQITDMLPQRIEAPIPSSRRARGSKTTDLTE